MVVGEDVGGGEGDRRGEQNTDQDRASSGGLLVGGTVVDASSGPSDAVSEAFTNAPSSSAAARAKRQQPRPSYAGSGDRAQHVQGTWMPAWTFQYSDVVGRGTGPRGGLQDGGRVGTAC